MLCERGIRTFESHTRFTLPLATVPYLHQKTHLKRRSLSIRATVRDTPLVTDMALAAIAAGADGGLIIEVHPEPEKAMSDGYQSLTFPQFETLMKKSTCRRSRRQEARLERMPSQWRLTSGRRWPLGSPAPTSRLHLAW
ncbi:MAG: hypothetical protein R3B96_22330 [Pirellulaceae bacterium]